MINVPKYLYTKEIITHLEYLIDECNAKYFDDLDTLHKDKLVALGIKALDGDLDIVIGYDANRHLAASLLSYDKDDQIELFKSIQESAYEKFSGYFDVMISEITDEIRTNFLIDAGFRSYMDKTIGETEWISHS